MNKTEIPPSQEPSQENPSPYEIIPELQDAKRVLTDQAHRIVIDFLSNPNRTVVVPLIGGVVPLYYTLEHLSQRYPKMLDLFLNQINYLNLSKATNTPGENGYNLWFSQPEHTVYNNALVIDGIADELKLEAMLQKFSGVISVHTAVQKLPTGEMLGIKNIGRLRLTTQVPLPPDILIASSCGINEGYTENFRKEAEAYLSTRQRFARSGYVLNVQNKTKEPNIDERINFFTDEVRMLPGFFQKYDPVLDAVHHMEILKAERRYAELLPKAKELTYSLLSKARQRMPYNRLVPKKR